MLDQPAVLLLQARQEARHVHEGDDRDVKRIAEPHKSGGLAAGINVQNAGQAHRLVRDEAHGPAVHPPEANHDVLAEIRADLKEVALIGHLLDQFLDIIGLIGVFRHQRVKAWIIPIRIIKAWPMRRLFPVRKRQEVNQPAHLRQGLKIVLKRPVHHAGLRRMHPRAAQLLVRHGLIRHGLHNVRTRHIHVARVTDHEDKVRHRRGIDIAPRTWPHDHADLRHNPRSPDVTHENLSIASKAINTLLDARTARIEDANHRRPVLQRLVLHLHDLFCVGHRQRSAEHGEVFRKYVHHPAIDRAPAGHDPVAGDLVVLHPELGAAVFNKHVELFEAAFVQQQLDPLPRRELALGVLVGTALFPAPVDGGGAFGFETFEDGFHEGPVREGNKNGQPFS